MKNKDSYTVQANYGNGYVIEFDNLAENEVKTTVSNIDDELVVDNGAFEVKYTLTEVRVLKNKQYIKFSHLLED